MKIANVLYVKVGVVTSTKLENNKRTELISGIKKYPVSKAYLTKTGFKEDFQYLGVWSKPNLAPFVCIEPWFGIADEENSNQNIEDKRGVQVLLKDELFSCFYSIEV